MIAGCSGQPAVPFEPTSLVDYHDGYWVATLNATTNAAAMPTTMPQPWALELVWWVRLPRLATRERLVPLELHTTVDIPEKDRYEAYFGVRFTKSHFNGVIYSAQDADRPFLTASEAMWSIFEPQLNQRMQDLLQTATYAEKVRVGRLWIAPFSLLKSPSSSFRQSPSYAAVNRAAAEFGLGFCVGSPDNQVVDLRCTLPL